MTKEKEQSTGRTENAAIPGWKNQRHTRTNTAKDKPALPGQSTENAGMSRQGLGKTDG